MAAMDTIEPFRLVSFGGVGSKMIVEGLSPSASVETLRARHRHDRTPPADAARAPWVYVFGDPRDAVLSFFMRQESMHSVHGFRAGPRAGQNDWPIRHCQNIGGDAEALTKVANLDAFLSNGVDHFRLREHLEGWLAARLPLSIFIRYESVWDHLDELCDRLGLPNGVAADFPAKQPRAADHRKLSVERRDRFNQIYDPLVQRINGLPDFFIVGNAGS